MVFTTIVLAGMLDILVLQQTTQRPVGLGAPTYAALVEPVNFVLWFPDPHLFLVDLGSKLVRKFSLSLNL